MSCPSYVISLIIIFVNIELGLFISEHPKLLIVSYDGFRYDYFERNVTPYMDNVRKENTYADYMMNIFVTKTFPNHHSIATGLYAEKHGVIDSEFYDPTAPKNVTKYSYKLYHYDNDIFPIWTINQKAGNGRHTGTMMWPGSSYEYQGTLPTFVQVYNESISFKQRIDTLISWFVHPTNPINLGILYIEEPDFHGHAIGINGPIFNEILTKLDNLTEYLHKMLEQNNLLDVNVVHVSDHGMSTVTIDRIVNLTDYVNDTDYTYVGLSPALHIYPNPGKEETVYQNLKAAAEKTNKFKVYRKAEIPKKYHYSNNTRIGPIFIVAEVGYAFQNLYDAIKYYEKAFNITVSDKSEFGLHGYDNGLSEMHPMFFAKGPAFVPGCKLNPFNNTDLFPLFCELLKLDCPRVNGTLTHVSQCLMQKSANTSSLQIIFLAGILIIVGIVITAVFFVMRKRIIMRARCLQRSSYDVVG